jgi:hypothetical protein
VEIVHRNGSLNCIIINLYFLLGSVYKFKHVKENRHYRCFPELLVSAYDAVISCDMFLVGFWGKCDSWAAW